MAQIFQVLTPSTDNLDWSKTMSINNIYLMNIMSTETQNLAHLLRKWDGKKVGFLEEIYEERAEDGMFWEKIVFLAEQEKDLQKAATWLIKHHYDLRNELPQKIINQLLVMCNDLESWEAQLHVLQLLPFVAIAQDYMQIVEYFVRTSLQSKHKFVRAWTFQGFFEIVKIIPEYAQELYRLCQEALPTESASVQSKLRKVIRSLEKSYL
jgi:hypothetical protein